MPPKEPAPTDPIFQLAEVVGLLRAGASPSIAWHTAGVATKGDEGVPVLTGDDAVAQAVAAACRLAHRSGAPLAGVLEVVGAYARKESEAHAAREAAIAGPRLSAVVLQWLPVAGLTLGAIVDPRALSVLFLTPLGWTLLAMAGGLLVCGRYWMRRLVRSAQAAGDAGAPTSQGRQAGDPPVSLVMALVEAAVSAGLDVRGALAEVGAAIAGPYGRALDEVASSLALADGWDQAWSDTPESLHVVERALRSAWVAGTAPRATLAAAADALGLQRRLASERAVGELGVRMALPLTLCLLPAFALVGLVPMLVAVASTVSVAWE
jgi:tight adherence protein B